MLRKALSRSRTRPLSSYRWTHCQRISTFCARSRQTSVHTCRARQRGSKHTDRSHVDGRGESAFAVSLLALQCFRMQAARSLGALMTQRESTGGYRCLILFLVSLFCYLLHHYHSVCWHLSAATVSGVNRTAKKPCELHTSSCKCYSPQERPETCQRWRWVLAKRSPGQGTGHHWLRLWWLTPVKPTAYVTRPSLRLRWPLCLLE